MNKNLFENAFLKARIKHDVITMANLAVIVRMKPEKLRAKIRGEQPFDIEEMDKIIDVLNVSSGSECCLLFFLHKDAGIKAHYNLYKAILENDIPPAKIALEIGVSLETLFDKIMGAKEFKWNEVIAIKEKFFQNYTMSILFERGVTA